MCQSIDKQTLLWRLSENKNIYYNACTAETLVMEHTAYMCQVRWPIWCKLKSVVVPGRVSTMRIGQVPMFGFVVCVGNMAKDAMWCLSSLQFKTTSLTSGLITRNFSQIPWLVFWCFYFLNKYWLTPIRWVLIVAAYLVKVKINYETYFSEAWYKLYTPLGPLRVDSVSRATGFQYFIYYRHQETHRYQYCS